MKCEFISSNGSESLVLFFTGWGMDATPFRSIDVDCDMAIIWDYSDLNLDTALFKNYQNIYLFAWSFGVFAASRFLSCNLGLTPMIVFKMAINGTQFPIDNHKGIPDALFNSTRDNLSERSIMKFYRRICRNSQEYQNFILHRPNRTLKSLYDELTSIEHCYHSSTQCHPIMWDKAVIAKCDLIFPFENQLNGWENLCSTVEIDESEAHMPDDFSSIINRNIINKQLIKQRFSSSFASEYENKAIVQRQIAKSLYRKWINSIGIRQDAAILEIGCGTGFLTRLYVAGTYPSRLVLNDLCNIPTITLNLNTTNYEFIEKDAEQLDFPDGTFDYVVSSSAIQWLENLPLFLSRLYRWLKPNGAIILSSFGHDNMKEIRDHIKISLNYKSTEWFRNEIKCNFDIVLISEEYKTVSFNSPIEVLRHIQSTGVNSINSKKVASSSLKHLLNNYPAVDGKFPLTYNPIYIIATKK